MPEGKTAKRPRLGAAAPVTGQTSVLRRQRLRPTDSELSEGCERPRRTTPVAVAVADARGADISPRTHRTPLSGLRPRRPPAPPPRRRRGDTAPTVL